MYVVQNGTADVLITDHQGEEHIVSHAGPGATPKPDSTPHASPLEESPSDAESGEPLPSG